MNMLSIEKTKSTSKSLNKTISKKSEGNQPKHEIAKFSKIHSPEKITAERKHHFNTTKIINPSVTTVGEFDTIATLQKRLSLSEASYENIKTKLSGYDISFMWNESWLSPEREGFRPSYETVNGEGASLVMPISGAYVCKPGLNSVYLPEKTDRSLVDYMQKSGFLGDVVYFSSLTDMIENSKKNNKKIYSIDDYGSKNDNYTVNDTRTMNIVNSKDWVHKLSSYACPEIMKPIDELQDSDFNKLHQSGKKVYLKV